MSGRRRLVAYGITLGSLVLFVLTIYWLLLAYDFTAAACLLFAFCPLLVCTALYMRLRHPIGLYSYLLALMPGVWLYSLHRGHAYLRRAQYDLALGDFERALQLRPSSAIAYNGRGTVYARTGRMQEALPNFDQALRWNPRLFQGYLNRAYVYDRLTDYQRALADIHQALLFKPRFAMAYLTRADVYAKLRDYQQALEDIEMYRRMAPRAPLAYSNRARIQSLLGNWPQALQDYTTALTLPARFVRAYDAQGRPLDIKAMIWGSRALLYSSLRDYQRAFQDASQAVVLAPNYALGYYARGLAHLGLNKWHEAQKDFEQAARAFPSSSRFRLLLAWIEMCQVKPDLALAARLEEIAESAPGESEAHICRGIALWLRGSEEEALGELEQAGAMEQERWEEWKAFFWRALICGNMMRDDEALEALRHALATGMPPALAGPLRWLEEARPEFYAQSVAPLLADS